MGWMDLYKRIMPASKRQVTAKTDQLKKNNEEVQDALLKQMEVDKKELLNYMKNQDQSVLSRLERLERLLEMGSFGVTKEKRTPQLIVTLTSYPKRISTVPLVLERLVNQTVRPDRIILYLSEDNFPGKEDELPQRLLDFRELGVEIHWCKEDIKSYKKLIPALEEYPDDILITVDDDLYYDLDIVERLYDSYRRFPRAISAFRVHEMRFDEDGKLLPYDQWRKCISQPINMPSMRLFATTGDGTLFPPHIFDNEIFNQDVYMKLCGNADDVWFKIMSVMNAIPVVLVDKYKGLQFIDGTQQERLWDSNEAENDEQIQAVLNYYADYRINGQSIEEQMYIVE